MPQASADLSFLNLILDASPLVQLVMAALIIASLLSWTLIFDRSRVLKKARREAEEFEERFWSGGDLGQLYRNLDRERDELRGEAAIFMPASASSHACARTPRWSPWPWWKAHAAP